VGCDIHCYVERFDQNDGEWHVEFQQNPYYDPPETRLERARQFRADEPRHVPYAQRPLISEEEAARIANDPAQWDNNSVLLDSGYSDRNYGLFAILADVRNGHGFAGVRTGEPTVPISAPRGVPDDASDGYRDEVRQWGEDGHSHTWFTLAELLAYDWDGQYAVNSFLVHPRGLGRGEPLPADFDFDAWAIEVELVLNVQGEGAARERWPAMSMAGGVSGKGADEWRRVSWKASHRQQAGEAWFAFLEGLKTEADRERRPYEHTRVVAFFDN